MTTSRSSWGAAAVALSLISSTAVAQAIAVPSGAAMELFDVILEEEPSVGRFRFVVPAISPDGVGLKFEDVMNDIDFLCDEVVLPALLSSGKVTETVVISLSEQEIAFGEIDASVTQFFQSFQIIDESCIWEEF